MTKICTKCKLEKDLDQFRYRNKAKGTRAPWCKSCYSTYERNQWKSNDNRRKSNIECNKTRRQRNHQFIWDYLSQNPCVKCGENDPVVLEFDHRDPKQKHKDLSTLTRASYSIEAISNEIAKCDVLCANCHRRKTAIQFGWYKQVDKTT